MSAQWVDDLVKAVEGDEDKARVAYNILCGVSQELSETLSNGRDVHAFAAEIAAGAKDLAGSIVRV